MAGKGKPLKGVGTAGPYSGDIKKGSKSGSKKEVIKMLNKHKLFLLCAKWIPVVTAIGILVTNTIAYYGCSDLIIDIFNFNIGTSVAGVILMYICSYAFNFCLWHKLVITYNTLIIVIVFIIRYCITECSYSYLLLSYYILAGIILLLILYIHSKKKYFH